MTHMTLTSVSNARGCMLRGPHLDKLADARHVGQTVVAGRIVVEDQEPELEAS